MQLNELPVLWTTWTRWRDAHPDTQVLSTDTGSIRNYGEDPYGSYTPLSGYYRPGSRRFFPVMHDDPRFDPKEVVIGIKHGSDRLAVPKALVRERGVVMARSEGRPLAVLHDPALDDARVFLAEAGGVDLELVHEQGRFADRSSGLIFDAHGRSIGQGGRVEVLPRVVAYDVMWFAWVAFFPSTQVIA